MYKKFLLAFEAIESWIAEKWVNSLLHVKEQLDNEALEDERFANKKIWERVTGKSIFKDLDILMENYEQKTMCEIYFKGE